MYDVVVVGGNLAGATAAIQASKFGAKVVLIEKKKEVLFPPRCGEATDKITAEILELEKIGCPINPIKQISLNISSKKEFNFKFKKHAIFIIDRYFLESYLLKNAKENKIITKIGYKVVDYKAPNDVILDDGEIIKGKIIIDASGINCQIGKKIGFKTKLEPSDIGVCIQSRVEGNFNPDVMKMWSHKPYAPFGYAWLFPKSKKLANIGIGIPGDQKVDLASLLQRYIENETHYKYKIVNTFRSCVPSSKPMSTLTNDNVMIVGDAARLANPLLENGINTAVFSGTVAGITAAKYIKGIVPRLDIYDSLMRSKVERLTKAYLQKHKLNSEEKFIKYYLRMFSILNSLNKLFPNILQNQLLKIVKKDKKIIDSLKNC